MKAWQWFPRELCWPAAGPRGWARPRRPWSGTGRRCCAGRSASCARAANGPVVVVRATGQDLPDLPKGTMVVDDPREGKGPVQGIAAGLAALGGQAETAFIASTDLPFLHPAFIRRVLRVLEQAPRPRTSRCRSPAATSSRWPPPTASRSPKSPSAWSRRTGCGPRSCSRSAGGNRLDDAALLAGPGARRARPGPGLGAERQHARRLPGGARPARARGDRPALRRPRQAARAAPAARGPSAPRPWAPPPTRRASSFDRHVTAALNGDQITRDGTTPLAAGDTVFFMSADAGG